MSLTDILKQRREAILKRWHDLVLKTYPPDTARFLQREKDQFANPVGAAISRALDGLYSALVRGDAPDEAAASFDHIVRIRAVQEFAPSEAVYFMFQLKTAIREELARDIRASRASAEEMTELERRIDDFALFSFDLYMKCREKIYELQANEVRKRAISLLERSNLVSRTSDSTDEDEGTKKRGNG
ncbi:MAG: RsbRD N-terminal domain-containing protein [Candidatus Abyssubacteria bacterium]